MPDMSDKAFKIWMSQVDATVGAIAMCSAHDLPDICYRDLFEGGATPKEAAEEALEYADFPMEIFGFDEEDFEDAEYGYSLADY